MLFIVFLGIIFFEFMIMSIDRLVNIIRLLKTLSALDHFGTGL
jgi:hypothetical protein